MTSISENQAPRRKALGRGLGALLPTRPVEVSSKVPTATTPPGGDQVRQIPIDLVDPNPYQPRRTFRQESLEELARSIQVDGLIQPIVVSPKGDRYTLIVGERRCRAAKLAGKTEIAAIVQQVEPERILEVTLVENIQREDLNPIEVASALERMIQELQLSHEEVAARTGKDRSTISNLLRILRLPKDIQLLVTERRLSLGHARALLSLEDEEQQRVLAERTAAQGLSVRQVERTVRSLTEPRKAASTVTVDPNVAAAIEEMERALGTPVRVVQRTANKGKIEIEFHSAQDLDRIYTAIVGHRS
jgi:ParB family chromosome partitioning protein